MRSLTDVLFIALTSAFSVATVMFYFIYLLDKRFANAFWLMIPAIFVFIVPTFLYINFKNTDLNFIVTIMAIFFTALFFKPIKRGLFHAIFLEVIILLSDGLIVCTFSMLSLKTDDKLIQITTCFITAILVILFAIRFKYFQNIDLPRRYIISFVAVPACSIVILYVIYNLLKESRISSTGAITIVVMIYILNIISIFMYSNVVNYFMLMVQSKAQSCQIEAFVDKQSIYSESFKDLYTLQHNMKNQLVPISILLESGEIDTAKNKLADILGNFDVVQYSTYTGIALIDDMINYKRFLAENQSVQFQVHSDVTQVLNINFVDLSTIIGIALDNAIEASVESVEKNVKLELFTQENAFIVNISNYFSHTISRHKNGTILSTKNDNKPHGIGLMTIKALIDKNNGEQRILIQDGIFKISLILFGI